MSGGSLSSRVKNMKFMQVAGDNQRKHQIDNAEKEETKKLKDLSEWSLPVNKKTLRVLKNKNKKIKRVGYSSINAMGPVILSENLNNGTLGRKTLSSGSKIDTTESSNREHEKVKDLETIKIEQEQQQQQQISKSDKKLKSKKTKKIKKKSKIMDDFKENSEDDFDPTEVDLTSKSLLDLWKSKKK